MEVTIEKLVYGGAGLARTEQGVIFVPKTAPGDVVDIDLTERRKDYAVGTLRSIVSASESRQPTACPNFETVGCCHWDHIRYERQIEYKKAIIRESLSRLAKTSFEDEIGTISGDAHEYRMRAGFHLRDGALGFVRENSNIIVPISRCAALAPDLNRFIPLASALKVFAARADVVTNSAQMSATFHFGDEHRTHPWERWRDALFGIPGLVHLTFVTGSRRLVYHKAEPFIEVSGHQYLLTSDAFFQANRFLLPDFVAEVLASAGPSPTDVLELYSGSGFFSIPIAQGCRQLIGVEINRSAVRQARQNAEINDVRNVEFAAGNVDATLAGADLHPEVVVVNPPRTGTGPKVAVQIAELRAARIVYISCNPTTFASDIRMLYKGGYRLKRLTLIDQFPNTYHIELVARFELE